MVRTHVCYASGTPHAYMTILIDTVKIQCGISYDHDHKLFSSTKNLGNQGFNISVELVEYLYGTRLIPEGIEFHVQSQWVFILVCLISSVPYATCRSLACPVFSARISELYANG